jgi:WD40 repeat protein
VFLSHHHADQAVVEQIAQTLRRSGLRPWLDSWHLAAGVRWQPEVAAALAACASCAVLVGPADVGAWERQELEVALERDSKDPEFRVFLVLLPGAPDPFDAAALSPFLSTRTWVDLRHGVEDLKAVARLVNAVKGLPPGADRTPDRAESVCPYRGLQTFDEAHAEFFFGREADVQRALEKLKASRFLAVIGASGSGKSSLVRAGVLPALRTGAAPGMEESTVRVLVPGAQPLTTLAAHLVRLQPNAGMQRTVDELTRDSRTFHLAASLLLIDRPRDEGLLWVVDQAEELFTLCRDEHERAQFLANLLYAATAPDGRTSVILTLRADFYGRLAAYPEVAQAAAAHQILVAPLEGENLRRVIEEPARRVGLTFDPGLVDTILDDVEHEPGALPLLEHALLELWNRRNGRRLTLEGYRKSGGVDGALAQRADQIYEHFTPEQRAIARRTLLRLTEPGEGTEDTRSRAARNELTDGDTDGDARVAEVIDALVDARMLMTSVEPQTGAGWVDVSHEALIRAWPRLRGWIDEDRAGLRTHRRITEAARDWDRLGEDPGALLRGTRLAEAIEWRNRRPSELNVPELDFLAASEELTNREERRAKLVLRGVVGVLCAATLISALAAVVVLNQRAAADRQARTALARQLTQKSSDELPKDLGLGLLLAVAAAHFEHSPRARAALVAGVTREPRLLRLTPPSAGAQIVALHLDRRNNTFTSVSRGGAVVRWSVGTMRRKGPIHRVGAVKSADISADGRRLAAVSSEGRFRIWDLRSMRGLGRGWHEPGLRGIVQLSRDGRTLLALSMATTTRNAVWRINSEGRATRIRIGGPASRSRPISLGGGGRYLAYGASRGGIMVQDLASGLVRAMLPSVENEPVGDLELSGDGRTVAALFDESDRMLFWQVGSRVVRKRTGRVGSPDLIEFSPDSRRVAVSLDDGTVTVWNSRTGQRVSGPATAGLQAGYAFAFEPGGDWLLYGRSDGTIARLDTTRRWPAIATRMRTDRIRLADLSFADLTRRACRIVNRNLTQREWREYVGAATPYERICSRQSLKPV